MMNGIHAEDLQADSDNLLQAADTVAEILGQPTETGERWSRFRGSNGTARFEILQHSSGSYDVFLIGPFPLMLRQSENCIDLLRCLIGIGYAKPTRKTDGVD